MQQRAYQKNKYASMLRCVLRVMCVWTMYYIAYCLLCYVCCIVSCTILCVVLGVCCTILCVVLGVCVTCSPSPDLAEQGRICHVRSLNSFKPSSVVIYRERGEGEGQGGRRRGERGKEGVEKGWNGDSVEGRKGGRKEGRK